MTNGDAPDKNLAEQPPLEQNASEGDTQPELVSPQLSDSGTNPIDGADGETEPPTEPPLEPPTDTPMETTMETTTEPPTETPMDTPMEPPTETPTEPPTDTPTEPPTDPPKAEVEAASAETAGDDDMPPKANEGSGDTQDPADVGAVETVNHGFTAPEATPLSAQPSTIPSAPRQPPAEPSSSPEAAAPAAAPRPPSNRGPAMGGGGGMRELRVEDALLYLDDVKKEFGDRPRVYNEFLAIMKNFKTQEVDTPGVIARVSKLFRGYNNLILGFNKFLPDGYKISLEDLETQDAIYAREQEELRRQQEEAAIRLQQEQLASHRAITNITPRPPNEARAMHAPPVPPPKLSQGFSATFPSQAVQQAHLIKSAQQGFMPHALPQTLATEQVRRSPGVDENMDAQPLQPPGTSLQGLAHPPVNRPSPPGLSAQQRPPQPSPPSNQNTAHMAAQPQRQASAPVQPAQQHQAVEFDHAISYVTTIKRRFANDPNTYHSFLEILHTYQKEQRGIKDVLEQVAHLFQDHPDLLKEFTFFLPDAVQEQAKERLHRAAADSEARQAAQRAQLEQLQYHGKKGKKAKGMEVDGHGTKLIDMTGQQMAAAEMESTRGRKRSITGSAKEAPVPIALPQQPETYVYNSAVERQFFDAAREALASYTRDGGQAWAEFLKCLDMYAQEILSKSEMLNFVEPLLGKRNTKLFEEFKRILGAAGVQSLSQPSMEDSWHSVPLSEIDFSRCRRCSPSYRALPRDYPAPPCSERNEEEAKVLNNVWVSLPVGSEESYTFRHMRRNTYEEILFRCEDERFEIDMIIDSNKATLARLEPIAEEIAQLAENELIIPETSNVPTPAPGDRGMGGNRFQYSFDKTILGVIHRNSIARIYGDAGQEMLDLMVKNPTVTIPLVVKRLRQKEKEWLLVRERMNRRWRDLAEHNYYRSLDHRSLTWRTTDKRAISTRTLVSEIKDRAAHNGYESTASLQARIDKAKEEHGTFYEVTMASTMKRKLDLTNLPKPDRRLFTPHLSLMYENNNFVHRDAYRILSFALERGAISPADKERCHRLWTEFLGPWFNLSLNWMLAPAVTFQETSKSVNGNELTNIVSNGEESPAEDDEEESLDEDADIPAEVVTEEMSNQEPMDKGNSPSYMDHHPLPAGSTVSTPFGEGRVIKCRRKDDTYVVKLPFGKAYLRPSAVLCTVVTAEKSAYTTQLRADYRTKLERPDDRLAIGTQSLYLFFRLHQILVRRLGIAKEIAYGIKDDGSVINMVEQMPGEDAAALGRKRYDAYLSLVYALLDGGVGGAEGGKYEDRVRCLLGHGGYELATMDKLISHILKNLQTMANDDTMWNLIQLYRRHFDAGSFKPEAFRQEAAFLSDGEAMYAFQMCPVHKDGGEKAVLHFEYLGVISESEEEDGSAAEPVEVPPVKRQKRER